METLRQKQSRFVRSVGLLIGKIYALGYEATLGDGYRDPRVFGKFGEKVSYSNANSCHKLRLAIDLNLFKDGKYLTATEDYRPIGEYWESLGGVWGGSWGADGNHFSYEHDGFK